MRGQLRSFSSRPGVGSRSLVLNITENDAFSKIYVRMELNRNIDSSDVFGEFFAAPAVGIRGTNQILFQKHIWEATFAHSRGFNTLKFYLKAKDLMAGRFNITGHYALLENVGIDR